MLARAIVLIAIVFAATAQADETCELPTCPEGAVLSCSVPIEGVGPVPCYGATCTFDYWCDADFDGFVTHADWDHCALGEGVACDDPTSPDFQYCRCNYFSEGFGWPYVYLTNAYRALGYRAIGHSVAWIDASGASQTDDFPHLPAPGENVSALDLMAWKNSCGF